MRIFRHYSDLSESERGGVVAIGNFDGVHRGHQAVVGTAVASARERRVPAGVFTFEPHPRSVFAPAGAPFRLTSLRTKAHHVAQLGVDFIVMQHFDLAFAAHTPEEFVDEVLLGGLGVVQVVVGYDFVFGRARQGNADVLRRLAVARGFIATCLPPVQGEDGAVYSATRIREALAAGRPREAARLLGRDWEIEGRVQRGDQRGRELGFPTANLALGESLRPAHGVYAVRAGLDEGAATRWLPGVAYCGPRPTFGRSDVVLEVHLFDFAGDLYGRELRVAFVDFLRPDRRFDSVATLQAQMAEDDRAARRLLNAPREERPIAEKASP